MAPLGATAKRREKIAARSDRCQIGVVRRALDFGEWPSYELSNFATFQARDLQWGRSEVPDETSTEGQQENEGSGLSTAPPFFLTFNEKADST